MYPSGEKGTQKRVPWTVPRILGFCFFFFFYGNLVKLSGSITVSAFEKFEILLEGQISTHERISKHHGIAQNQAHNWALLWELTRVWCSHGRQHRGQGK